MAFLAYPGMGQIVGFEFASSSSSSLSLHGRIPVALIFSFISFCDWGGARCMIQSCFLRVVLLIYLCCTRIIAVVVCRSFNSEWNPGWQHLFPRV